MTTDEHSMNPIEIPPTTPTDDKHLLKHPVIRGLFLIGVILIASAAVYGWKMHQDRLWQEQKILILNSIARNPNVTMEEQLKITASLKSSSTTAAEREAILQTFKSK
jgi:hypothetical protein